jgi:hypothetical protein
LSFIPQHQPGTICLAKQLRESPRGALTLPAIIPVDSTGPEQRRNGGHGSINWLSDGTQARPPLGQARRGRRQGRRGWRRRCRRGAAQAQQQKPRCRAYCRAAGAWGWQLGRLGASLRSRAPSGGPGNDSTRMRGRDGKGGSDTPPPPSPPSPCHSNCVHAAQEVRISTESKLKDLTAEHEVRLLAGCVLVHRGGVVVMGSIIGLVPQWQWQWPAAPGTPPAPPLARSCQVRGLP